MLIGVIVGVFYSLDALHGERRDRSILFWKSLPVSDLTTVLAKASIPLVVLPALVFAITVALQLVMRVLSVAVTAVHGAGATVESGLPLFEMQLVLLYGLAVITLWLAPIYCWMLLVSGWARRAAFLWAVLPPLALTAVERMIFGTWYFGSLMQDRLVGFAVGAFDLKDKNGVAIDPHFIPLAQLAPGRFLSSAGLRRYGCAVIGSQYDSDARDQDAEVIRRLKASCRRLSALELKGIGGTTESCPSQDRLGDESFGSSGCISANKGKDYEHC
jgi:ABC-2 type transport system permease protein